MSDPLLHILWTCWPVGLLVALWLMHNLRRQRYLRSLIPPGPRGVPVFGNIFQFSPGAEIAQMSEWARQFGPIYSLTLGDCHAVVINSIETAAELLDRRGNIYSHRPLCNMGSHLITHGRFLLFNSHRSKIFTRGRRATQERFNARASKMYRTIQEKEAIALIRNLLKSSQDLTSEFKRTTTSVVLSVLYGREPLLRADDPIIGPVHETSTKVLDYTLPGSSAIDIWPWLMYIPEFLSKWKQEGRLWFNRNTVLYEALFDEARAKAELPDCFASSLIKRIEENELSYTEAAWLAGNLLSGGSETSSSYMTIFMEAMSQHPDAMHRAQAEIDVVVGRERMPTFTDADSLPYTTALVKEVIRWNAVAPVGMSHYCSEDDWYNGYLIPKGTMVITNIWEMNRDPILFPNPDVFEPERWLDATGALKPITPNTHGQGHVAYGFGKRMCIGMHVANQTLFIDMTAMLWAFEICRDTQGAGGAFQLKPRHSEVVAVVENEFGKHNR